MENKSISFSKFPLVLFSIVLFISSCGLSRKKETTASADYSTPSNFKTGLGIMNAAPEIISKNTNDSIVSLSSLRGYYVLIDFWASWCRPCRAENPNLVASQKKFSTAKFPSAKGFRIFSVSLDASKPAWKKAIETDSLFWYHHVCDFKGWYSDAAVLYQVNSIPCNWLIDPRGVIIARNLRGKDLDQQLEKLISQ